MYGTADCMTSGAGLEDLRSIGPQIRHVMAHEVFDREAPAGKLRQTEYPRVFIQIVTCFPSEFIGQLYRSGLIAGISVLIVGIRQNPAVHGSGILLFPLARKKFLFTLRETLMRNFQDVRIIPLADLIQKTVIVVTEFHRIQIPAPDRNQTRTAGSDQFPRFRFRQNLQFCLAVTQNIVWGNR